MKLDKVHHVTLEKIHIQILVSFYTHQCNTFVADKTLSNLNH